MVKYEMGVVVRADLPEDGFSVEMDKVKALIDRFGGTIDKIDEWGRRRLAYPIAKQTEGMYTFITYTAEPTAPREIESRVRLIESVLRFLTVRKDEVEAVAAQAPAVEAPAVDAPAAEAEKAPVAEVPVVDVLTEETPVEEAPVAEAPAEEPPALEIPTENNAPSAETPITKTEDAPADEVITAETEEAPAEEIPAVEAEKATATEGQDE